MEANRKMRKGFIKGKLVVSLYRATQPYSNKPKPGNYGAPFLINQTHHDQLPVKAPKQKVLSTTSSSTTASSVGIIVNREKVSPQPKPKVSFMIPASESESKLYGKFDNPYGVVGDEGVDAKATSYISCVQERFKLERINSERQRANPDLKSIIN